MSATPSVLTREAGTSAAPTRPGRKRPSLAHILIVVAAILAFGLNYLALQNRDSTVLVAVAGEEMAIGSTLTASEVRLEAVPSDLSGIDGLVGEADLEGMEGWVVGVSVGEGDLLVRAALTPPASHDGLRLMSLPVPAAHAVGGSILPGDRVDVIAVVDEEPRFIADALEVVEVSDSTQGALAAGGSFFLVVTVDSSQALALSAAMNGGPIDVIRSTGAEPIAPGLSR